MGALFTGAALVHPAWVRALSRLADAIDGLNGRIGGAVAWLCLLMVGLGAWNAVARFLGRFIGVDLASNRFIEAQWYLFSLLFLLGAGAALRDDAHVRVDVLYGRLGRRGKAMIDLLGTVLFLLPFCVFGIVQSWDWVAHSWAGLEGSPDPGGLPRYPLKTVVPVAFALLALQGVSMVVRSGAVLFGADEAGADEGGVGAAGVAGAGAGAAGAGAAGAGDEITADRGADE